MNPTLPRPRPDMPLPWDTSLPTMTFCCGAQTPKRSPACLRGLPHVLASTSVQKSPGKEIVSRPDKAHIPVWFQSRLFQAGKGDSHAPVIPVNGERANAPDMTHETPRRAGARNELMQEQGDLTRGRGCKAWIQTGRNEMERSRLPGRMQLPVSSVGAAVSTGSRLTPRGPGTAHMHRESTGPICKFIVLKVLFLESINVY